MKSYELTEDNLCKGILRFAIPLVLSNFVQQLYNTVDAVILGNFVGDMALGAVGITNYAIIFTLVIFVGMATGGSALVAQAFGARDNVRLDKIIIALTKMTFLMGIVVSLLGIFLSDWVLQLMNTPESMYAMAKIYLVIIFAGTTGNALYNVFAAVLRGLGDSRSPLFILILATLLNLVLDLLFVCWFNLGTAGAAIATIMAQAVSAALCYVRIGRLHIINKAAAISREEKDWQIEREVFRQGVPVAVANAVFSLSGILITKLAGVMGDQVVVAFSVANRLDGFATLPLITMGIVTTVAVGQNFGAKLYDRVRDSEKYCLLIATICSISVGLLLVFTADTTIRFFTKSNVVLEMAKVMLMLFALGYPFLAIQQVFFGAFRSLNDVMAPMVISIVTMLGVRIPVAYLIALQTGAGHLAQGNPGSLCISVAIAELIGAAAVLRYQWHKRKSVFD